MALKKVGSLWKSDRGGKTVLSGKVERDGANLPPGAKLLIFKNDKGDNPKRPDFTLHVADDSDGPERAEPSDSTPDDESLPF